MKNRIKYLAMLAGSAVMLSSCAVYDYPMYTSGSVAVGGHGWSTSVAWTDARYDVNGFPIYGYYYGQPVYGYTAKGAAVFSFVALTSSCMVPSWGPAPWYCGHWHYPHHVRRVSVPHHCPPGHYPGRKAPHHVHHHHAGLHHAAAPHKHVSKPRPAVVHKPGAVHRPTPAHKPGAARKPAHLQKPQVHHKPAANHKPAVTHKPAAVHKPAMNHRPSAPSARPQSRPQHTSGVQRPAVRPSGNMQHSRPAGAFRGGSHSRGGGHRGPRR